MGVRKVVTRSGRGVRGYFPSRKMGRMIEWESLLERDAILLLEFSSAVVRYREQPTNVDFYMDGGLRRYIPDFEAEMTNEAIIHIEVKPASKLAKPEIAHRYWAIAKHYEKGNISFQILTEKELRTEPRLGNLKLLAYHQPKLDDESSLPDAMLKLGMFPAQTIAGVAAVLGGINKVYMLLAANLLSCNLDETITPETCICLQAKGGRHDAIFV